jgi:hypothetical protein
MISKGQLLNDLVELNEFFDVVVDMIPTSLYLSHRGDEQDTAAQTKYYRKAPKESSETKQAKRVANKAAKRRKLNPETVETTVQLQKKMHGAGGGTVRPSLRAAPSTGSPHHSRIEALRAKLAAKISAKQDLHPRQKEDPQQISKRAARRAEKERRREEAKKRKGSAAPSSASADATTHYSAQSPDAAKEDSTEASLAADLAAVDFGRLAGLDGTSLKQHYEQSNKALKNVSKSKNLHKLLADAETKRQTLQELKQGDDDQKEKAQQILWTDTLKEADGQRVKDDPAKIRKALKRKVAKKAKSTKQWQSRTAQVQKSQQDRQKIRTHNLDARKKGGQAGANLSRKEIKKPEEDQGRRLSRAGFEGRKRDFLNGEKKKNKDQ